MVSIIAGVVFGCLGAICAAMEAFSCTGKLPQSIAKCPKQNTSPIRSYTFGKMQKIKADYRRLYPTGKVEAWRVTLQIAMFAFLGLAAICLGFLKVAEAR